MYFLKKSTQKSEKHFLEKSAQKTIDKTSKELMKYEKNADGEFVCIYCGVVKRRQNTMRYHQLTHENELNHSCTICSKSFLQKQTLDMHMKSKHSEHCEEPAKYSCPFDNCAFTSLTKGNGIVHCLRIHCQEEIKEIMEVTHETKSLGCKGCEKTFASSCGFYYHVSHCLKQIATKTEEKQGLMAKLHMIASIQKEIRSE